MVWSVCYFWNFFLANCCGEVCSVFLSSSISYQHNTYKVIYALQQDCHVTKLLYPWSTPPKKEKRCFSAVLISYLMRSWDIKILIEFSCFLLVFSVLQASFTLYCRRMIPHLREGWNKVMHVKCRASINITTKNIFKLWLVLLIKLTGTF